MGQYRKKPVVVEAEQFTGANHKEMYAFTGPKNFDTSLDEEGNRESAVWDKLHNTWVTIYPQQWIVRGIKGEYYPCDAEVFEATYEKV